MLATRALKESRTPILAILSFFRMFICAQSFPNRYSPMQSFAKNTVDTQMLQLFKVLATQLCPALCDPMDCSPPGSSVHGILQARILKWVAIPFSRGQLNPGTESKSSALQADSLMSEPPGKPNMDFVKVPFLLYMTISLSNEDNIPSDFSQV